MQKLILKVNGMTCPSCEMIIKEELDELEGVQSTKANHAKGTVELEIDEKLVNEYKIASVIKQTGFLVES